MILLYGQLTLFRLPAFDLFNQSTGYTLHKMAITLPKLMLTG